MSNKADRVSYESLKQSTLESYFNCCRVNTAMKGWKHEQIIGYVCEQFEATFQRPVECLMWSVVLLILTGGWHEESERRLRYHIASYLNQFGLEAMLADVPVDESEVFRRELKTLKFI